MTILQLKYVIALANSSSMREAASRLYISQPALSTTIAELEEELNIKIFERTNKGISLTDNGRDFLSYAKQAVSQFELIEDRYMSDDKGKTFFSVSMQHYVFAVHAYVNTLKKFDSSKYVYSVYETRTDEVLNNVRKMKSEVGVISYTKSNENVMKKLFREYNLDFTYLMERGTFAYLWKGHPLSDRIELSISDLKEYPCVSFDQSDKSEYYLSEEALCNFHFDKVIKSNDRATSSELLIALNAFSIGTGTMMESLTLKGEFKSIKLIEQDPLTIGYIRRKDISLSKIGQAYIKELEKYKEEN